MDLLELPQAFIDDALQEPETGMGYQFVTAHIDYSTGKKPGFLIAGAYLLLQEEMEKTASAENVETERRIYVDVSEPAVKTASTLPKDASLTVLPPGSFKHMFRTGRTHAPTPPFVTKTTGADLFFRLSPFRRDRRIKPDGSVVAGTYSTSDNDMNEVPSGLAAVGRYALPSRLPAVHVFRIKPPVGTPVAYGTVKPNYGMAGGGVEAYFPSGCPKGSATYQKTIPVK